MRGKVYRLLPDNVRASLTHVFHPARSLMNRVGQRVRWFGSHQLHRSTFYPAVREYAISTRAYLNKAQPQTPASRSTTHRAVYTAVPDAPTFDPAPPRTLGYNPLIHLVVPANPPLFAAKLHNVRVYGGAGDVVTCDNTVLSDISFRVPVRMWHERLEHPSLERDPLAEAHRVHGPHALLTSRWAGRNYFHWMFNLLPRLAIFARAGVPLKELTFLTNTPRYPVQVEMLNVLGIPPEQIYCMNEETALKVESLWVTPLLFTTGFRRRWLCDWLRQHFMRADSTEKPTRRLYLSRADAQSRRLENEPEVMDILTPLGFERIVIGDSSIFDQSALFAQADVVLAPHTTGFANLVFCQPRTRVLDFMPPDRLKTYMWELSACMDLDYYYADAAWSTAPRRPGSFERDTIIHPATLRALLSAAGIK